MIRSKELIEQIDLQLNVANDNKKTILFVVDKLLIGGFETHIYDLSKELVKRGHTVVLDCNYISPIMRKKLNFIEIYEGLSSEKILEVIYKKKIDLIHCHPFESAKKALLLNELTKIPYVITWHGAYYTSNFPEIANKAEKVICVSQEVYDLLVKNYPYAETKLMVVENGIDLSIFKPNRLRQSSNEITFIGREGIDRLAGVKNLIKAFLQTSFARLNIVGFNPIEGVERDNRIYFAGEVENVTEYIKKADIVIATGRGIREALACGKPCIVMSNWGYDGIVMPSNFKKLEYANYSGRAFAEPLDTERITTDINLLTSESLREKLGEYGRYIAIEHYDLRKIVAKVEIIYNQVVKGKTTPTISIILPVYNQAQLIDKSLSSLLKQTYQDFEIIIINDGSEDNLSEIIAQYHDHRIVFISRERNLGLPKTLNEGLRHSSGKYITWTSADNIHEPVYLERLLRVLEENPDCGSVYSDYIQVDKNGKLIQKMSKGVYQLNGRVNYGPSFLFRSEVVNKVGFFDEALFGTEDRDYSIRVAAAAPVAWLPEMLYRYTLHDNSLTGKFIRKEIDSKPAMKGISQKWKSLMIAKKEESSTIGLKDMKYSRREVLPIMGDCSVNNRKIRNLNSEAILIGIYKSSIYRNYIKVNISHLTSDVRILKAELQLFIIRNAQKGERKIGVYQVQKPWNEKTIHWKNQPLVSIQPIDIVHTIDAYSWISFDITSLVQNWVDKDVANYGVCLKFLDEKNAGLMIGYNREYYYPIARPRLIVEYTSKNRCVTVN